MQIPKHFLIFDLLRQQSGGEFRAKASAQRAEAGSRPGSFSGQMAGRDVTPGLIRAGSLEEAVETLTAGGRLAPRGSLLDIKA